MYYRRAFRVRLRHDVDKSPRRLWRRPPFAKGANSWEKFFVAL